MTHDQFEAAARVAVGLYVLFLLLTRGVGKLLAWMDAKDWILIPNQEAVKNADDALMRAMLDVQAVVEPAKKQVVQRRVDEADERACDEGGEGGGSGPPPDQPVEVRLTTTRNRP